MTPIARPALQVLTSLRFFAALEVVLFHATRGWNGWGVPTNIVKGLVSGGYDAVTFFFVLSGMILTYVYAAPPGVARTTRPLAFWRLRFARLAPAYFLGLIIALPLAAEDGWVGQLILVPLLLQAWWPPAALLWNMPGWSLSVEAFFYAVFPSLERLLSRAAWPALLIGAYVLVVASSLYRFDTFPPDGVPPHTFKMNAYSYFPLFLLPQFLFGMAIGYGFKFGPRLSPATHAVLLGIGIAATLCLFAAAAWLPRWMHTDAVRILAFGLIVFGGAGADRAVPILTLPPLVLLGEASYSLYILHHPMLYLWGQAQEKLHYRFSSATGLAIILVLTIGASVLSFLYVETPLRRWISGRPQPHLAPA